MLKFWNAFQDSLLTIAVTYRNTSSRNWYLLVFLCLKKGFVSLRSHTAADSSIFFLLPVGVLSLCISGIYKLLITHLCIYYVILICFIKTLSYITKLFWVLVSPSSWHVRSYNCLFHKKIYIFMHVCMYTYWLIWNEKTIIIYTIFCSLTFFLA